MTQEETLDYNIRCAKFLGVDVDYSTQVYKDSKSPLRDYINNKPKSEPLLFDEDWNWIMRVVKEIENLYNGAVIVEITDKSCNISIYKFLYKKYTTMNTKIEAVTQAINQFLIWHEQNK